jgi:hypothetical protein
MTDRISWFKYDRHSERAAHEALGWVHCADIGHHGAYSSLYEWRGEGDPVMPHDSSNTPADHKVTA